MNIIIDEGDDKSNVFRVHINFCIGGLIQYCGLHVADSDE